MKKKWKSILSLVFVLVFVLQLNGPVARADNVSVSGAERLDSMVYVLSPSGELLSAASDEGSELLDGASYSVELGGTDMGSGSGGFSLNDLTRNDLSVTPPEGYWVALVYLQGDDAAAPVVPLETGASVTSVTIDSAYFSDADSASGFAEDLLSSEGDSTLCVLFAPADTGDSVTVGYDLLDEDSVGYGESYAVRRLSDQQLAEAESDGREFDAWELVYANGLRLLVKAGSSIRPFDDADLYARWENIPVDDDAGGGPDRGGDDTGGGDTGGGDTGGDDTGGDDTGGDDTGGDDTGGDDTGGDDTGGDDTGGDDTGGDDTGGDDTGGDDELTPDITDLTIEAVTAQKVYDGTPLKASEYSENGYTKGYKITGLAEGHRAEGVSVTISAESDPVDPTDPDDPVVTTVDVTELQILDDDDVDVTDQYNIKETVDGTLTITKRSLVITAISDKKAYNDQTYKAAEMSKGDFKNGYSVGGDGLVDGHTLSAITVTGEGKDAGKYTTSIAGKADITVSSDTDDVTDCYDIQCVDGKLEITKLPLTITAISGTATATGETIYASGYSGNGYTHGYKSEGLLDGHTLQGSFVTGSGKDKDFDTGIDASKVQIVNGKGDDVKKNYDITTVPGKMKIQPKKEATATPITVTASAKKVYDATPLTIGNSDIRVTQGTLPANYKLEASFGPTASITDVQKISVSLSNVKVKDANGNDVTSQYKITTVSGTLEVTKKPLTLTAESASKTYDGKALVNKNVRATALASKDHVLSVEYEITNSEGKVIKTGAVNVGSYAKKITNVSIKEGSRDVTGNYDIKKVDGTLTITAGSTKRNDRNPRTGDENNINLWLGILIVSAALALSILLLFVLRARKGKSKTKKAK